MTKEKTGAVWGKKHYGIRDITKYHLKPAPFVVDAVPFLHKHNIKTILDAGCGQGRNSLYLKKEGFEVIPVDASEEACRLTKKLFQQNNLSVTPIRLELQNLDALRSESVDAIVSVTVLTHILDPELVLKEFYRILKPGGLVIADFATVKDSTYPIILKSGISLGKNVFLEEGTNVKYFEDPEDVTALFYRFEVLSIQEITFEEPPHPGSRSYKHSHTSYVVTAQK